MLLSVDTFVNIIYLLQIEMLVAMNYESTFQQTRLFVLAI